MREINRNSEAVVGMAVTVFRVMEGRCSSALPETVAAGALAGIVQFAGERDCVAAVARLLLTAADELLETVEDTVDG